MNVAIESSPSYGLAIVTLDAGEEVVAEGGAMVAMSAGVGATTTFNGTAGVGLLGWLLAMLVGFARKLLGGESLFVNRFKATEAGQQVWLAPGMVGDVAHIELDGRRTVTAQSTSYLASGPHVEVGLVWAGFQMLFSGEGAVFLRCQGRGDLLLTSYGAIERIDVQGEHVIDSGHVVAFEGDLSWTLARAGGSWKSTLLSGEGMVMRFSGRGTVWVQTRAVPALVQWISPLLG